MERLLILNTATVNGAVGVAADGEVIAEERIELSHASNSILPTIDGVLKRSLTTMASVDRIVVVKGPGTFTGSRVGVSIGKGLSYALGKPLTGVTTFQAVAFTGLLEVPADSTPVWAMLDARRHQYCAQRFSAADGGLIPAGEPWREGSHVFDVLYESGGHVVCAYSRDAVSPEKMELISSTGATVWSFGVFPSCRGILAAASKLGADEDPFTLEPLYLRTTDELFDVPKAAT
ncbi:MAG: tRNA (adenosine(37)-N6)-threonylcarbamoyltransferase complex dimerization subunit type 1 TsaB [Caldisericota bacterium]|nr:tRNA (adenosine(37)-N6)-threonylcarbamoyltransferase complex dimerization subunit type 1 TsaB [Caldisericota bacterium]